MFHIFRNSPLGRENLLQSAYFCQRVGGLTLTVFIPDYTQCVMYCSDAIVTVELDASYTLSRETAVKHADKILHDMKLDYSFFIPASFTANELPDIPSDWSVMACPRVISRNVSRIGLGRIGSKVRSLVRHVSFPVFIPCACFKPWKRVCTLCGDSDLGANVVRQSLRLSEKAGVPMTLCTQKRRNSRNDIEAKIRRAGLESDLERANVEWRFCEEESLEESLYAVPSDSLVVVVGAGETLMREVILGSQLETVQKALPNPLLVVGPQARLL
jgi:hypothetical protein